jgi:hypothetical protein
MKKIFFLLLISSFVFLLSSNPPFSYAQTVVQTDTPVGVDNQATPSAQNMPEQVNYELPYPGMLPDNPLYVFKVIRDGIVKLLINNPLKKAEFSLLNSDKRMYAGKMLFDKGEDQLAIDTITKSNNYLDDALVAIKIERNKDPKSTDINPFLEQLKTASLKHQELMEEIEPSIDKMFATRLAVQKKRAESAEKTAKILLKQK